jgi:predicted DNA-binding protein
MQSVNRRAQAGQRLNQYGVFMLSEHVSVLLTTEQSSRVKQLAARRGEPVSSVIRHAVEAYLDDESVARRAAVDRLLAIEAPVDAWEVMKSQIEASRYPDLPGWKP